MRRTTLLTLATIPVLLIGLACGAGDSGTTTSGDESPNGPAGGAEAAKGVTTVAAGQPLTLSENILGSKTVAVVTLANVKAGVRSGNDFVKPGKGQFITADVTVEVKEGKYSINSSMFKLVAADGTAYDSTTMLDKQDLSGTDLTPGQKTAGTVVFDAAVGAQTGGKVALKSWLADGDAGYWTL